MATGYGSSFGPTLGRLAASQHGVFSRAQVLAFGIPEATIARRTNTGVWTRLYPGVYRLGGAPVTWKQNLLAACLAWGDCVFVSHRAAGSLFELAGFRPGAVELTVPRKRARALPHKVHRPRSLDRVDITTLDAIPVTTPARTLIDLATCVDADVLEDALDAALGRGLVPLWKLQRRMDDLGARTVLRDLVNARARGGVAESRLETKILRAIRKAALPQPKIQHRIQSYRVDFAYPHCRIAVECDGYRYHSSRRSFDADRARDTTLAGLGWRVLRVTWPQLQDGHFIETLAALLDAT